MSDSLTSNPDAAGIEMPPIALHLRRSTAALVGRTAELAVLHQEIARATHGQMAAVTLVGEPGIGKTRLLVAASEIAAEAGFRTIAATADEEIRGPFLLARTVLVNRTAANCPLDAADRATLDRAVAVISGRDDPELATLPPEQKLLRAYDLGALAVGVLAAHGPVALLLDDVQWADDDSVRLLRYLVRTAPDLPVFVMLAMRPEATTRVTEVATLIADMERMGMIRRLHLERFSTLETGEFLGHLLTGAVEPTTTAAIHGQAEGVPFIVEELARAYRETAVLQQVDGTWRLAQKAERLLPSAVKTLISRRAARLPESTQGIMSQAAVIGRSFSLRDLHEVLVQIGDETQNPDPSILAECLAPAVETGLLVELPETSTADYRFSHEQVREYATAALPAARRRGIHLVLVDMLAGDGEPPPESLPLLAHHALAAGDTMRAIRYSVTAVRSALDARAPEEAMRLVESALPVASAAVDRVALLTARDDALDMLRRPADRLEGLAELGALVGALADERLELDVMLRRAAALRSADDLERAGAIAADVRSRAAAAGLPEVELTAVIELGQACLGRPVGESFTPPAQESDLDGAAEAYERAVTLAEELGDKARLALSLRELGVISLGRSRAEFIRRLGEFGGEHPLQRVATGNIPAELFADLFPMLERTTALYERALAIFEELNDRRGFMSTVIAMAYVHFALDIHLQGAARRVEAMRRLASRGMSLARESDQSLAALQMAYGAHVFARAKCVPDLALSRGIEAYEQARALGDRSIEFAAATGIAATYLEIGDDDSAQTWVDHAATVTSTSPTSLRILGLEVLRGIAAAIRGDADGLRTHFGRAVTLAGEHGHPAARCEVLAELALSAARLGERDGIGELLDLAETSALEVHEIAPALAGRPPWPAQAHAAQALVAAVRGRSEDAKRAGDAALAAIEATETEDLHLAVHYAAAKGIIAGGDQAEAESARSLLHMLLAAVAQRTIDEEIRVAWFRGPLGRAISALAGPLPERPPEEAPPVVGALLGSAAGLPEDASRLLWLVIEGRTNEEIAESLGVIPQDVARRLGEVYTLLGATSKAEAAALAFRDRVL